jgi:Peroxisome biogenesis factor 1, N-terminal
MIQYGTKVLMEPVTTDDWELLEIHGKMMEHGGLLNQLTVVYHYQHLSIRVGNDTVNMIVKKISSFNDDEQAISRSVWPSRKTNEVDIDSQPRLSSTTSVKPDCAILVQDTEVIIAPKPRLRKQQSSSWLSPLQLIPSDQDWGDTLEILCRYSGTDPFRVDHGCIIISDEIWTFDSDWAMMRKAGPDTVKQITVPCVASTLVRVVRSSTIPSRNAGTNKERLICFFSFVYKPSLMNQ